MRKPPFPRAVPQRKPRECRVAVGACGVLALEHATRAAVGRPAIYLSLLDLLAFAAAAGVGAQLALVDDAISWLAAASVAVLLGSASIVAAAGGLPGANGGLGGPLVSVLASVSVLAAAAVHGHRVRDAGRPRGTSAETSRADHPAAAATRPGRPRTPRPARLVARARQGTARARAARPDPARPAA
jgi:hypothetical protein